MCSFDYHDHFLSGSASISTRFSEAQQNIRRPTKDPPDGDRREMWREMKERGRYEHSTYCVSTTVS